MALFTKIDVIPHELYQELKGDHEDIILKDESGSYNWLHKILDDQNYPPDFRNLLVQIKLFLSFPYIQYDAENPYSFEEEFTMRIGQVYSLFDIYSQGNRYILGFISRQIEDLISLVGQEKIQIEFMTRAEFDKMVIMESQEVYFRPIYAEDKDEPDVQDIVIPVFHLRTDYQKSGSNKIFGEPIEVIKADINKFLLYHELGIIDLLKSNWGWAGKFESDGKLQSLGSNDTAFARFLANLLGFDNPETLRTYLRDIKSRDKQEYFEKKKSEIQQLLSAKYGIKRMT